MHKQAAKRGHHAILRAAVAADAFEIAEVFLASRQDALPYLPTLHSDEETRRWIPDIVMRRSEVWVAELDGKIVGFLSVAGEHLDHLYIRPGYYRQGIGDRLLAKAKAISPQRLRLFTFQRNERARAFYEARGFVPIDFNGGSRNEEGEPDVLYEWAASRASLL
ncbi:MAG TPA: GNAT family N-acetyltransferase [bacterium]|nr:GNAT family N-acetyltransferase [bacterium]